MDPDYHAIRPGTDEYAPYYETYVAGVPDGDILATLAMQSMDSLALLSGVSAGQAKSRYARGKWSVKEVVGHVCDAERIFAYRALRFARNDPTPLAAFDENHYAQFAGHGDRAIADLADELERLRVSTLDLLAHLDEEAWLRRGTASGHPISVRALAWIIAGHELHHFNIIRNRYLKTAGS